MGPKTDALKLLCKSLGKNYVGFRGDPKAPIWLVGEAPGAEEDQQGFPFVGYSGRELDKMLVEAGLKLKDCCFVNPYKVRPPDNEIQRIEETGIKKEIFEEQFFEELNFYKPSFIVTLGSTSTGLLCPETYDRRDKESKISKWRGSLLQSQRLLWPHYVLPNFHPAYILREWSDRDVAVFIFRKLFEEFDFWSVNKKLQPLPERQLLADPTTDEAREYLEECLQHDAISCDIELIARKVPICIGISFSRSSALSVEFFGISSKDGTGLYRLINEILHTRRIVGQNWTTFDCNWMEAFGFDGGMHRIDDCLVRHHVLHPEMSHKLDFQVLQYTRQPYYKDEGRGWQFREGLTKLKRYNCLDACCTLEVYEEQEKEFDENPSLKAFYQDYEMPLAQAFHSIDKRGIATDTNALAALRREITTELDEKCISISKHLGGRPVADSARTAKALAKNLQIDQRAILNINAPQQIKDLLQKDLKIKLKVSRISKKESTGEESLNAAFAETGNPILKDLLRTRELNKILGTYVNAPLCNNVFYSCYSVTGTITGRRASRKNFLGFGSNGQNSPQHSDLGERFQGIYIARPNHIFVYCDQASAEEWIVQGIIADVSGNTTGIQSLKDSISSGISRHAVLASQIFNLPIEQVNNKECLEYYMGKKTRHACNYDMRENTMASQMAAEGFPVKVEFCKAVQTKFHMVEPLIRQVFHKHIRDEVTKKRKLRTPLGRERVFHGLRPFGDNDKIIREAFDYIPQSTIGDNNGMAILWMEQNLPGKVLADGHDSMLCETKDTFESVVECVEAMKQSYKRIIKFPNGFEVEVPVDFKIGYTKKGLKKCPDTSRTGLRNILLTLARPQNLQNVITNGVPSAV